MSMNITLRAETRAEIEILGKKSSKVIREWFECINTTTAITKDILKAEDKTSAYIDFINSKDWVEEEEAELAGFHLKELNEFLEEHEGWDIIWDEI